MSLVHRKLSLDPLEFIYYYENPYSFFIRKNCHCSMTFGWEIVALSIRIYYILLEQDCDQHRLAVAQLWPIMTSRGQGWKHNNEHTLTNHTHNYEGKKKVNCAKYEIFIEIKNYIYLMHTSYNSSWYKLHTKQLTNYLNQL
jgi:hypothetical protein